MSDGQKLSKADGIHTLEPELILHQIPQAHRFYHENNSFHDS